MENVKYKVCLTGKVGVGKTSIFNRARGKPFSDIPKAQTDRFIYKSSVKVPNEASAVEVNIWDTAGTDRYQSLSGTYYRNSNFIAVVFSLGCEESFSYAKQIVTNIKQCDYSPDSLFLLVGNKTDLDEDEIVVQDEKVFDYLHITGHFIQYMKTSAKDDRGITELFDNIAYELMLSKVKPIEDLNELNALYNEPQSSSIFTNCC